MMGNLCEEVVAGAGRNFCQEVVPAAVRLLPGGRACGASLYTDANGLRFARSRCARPWCSSLEVNINSERRGYSLKQVVEIHAGLQYDGVAIKVYMTHAQKIAVLFKIIPTAAGEPAK